MVSRLTTRTRPDRSSFCFRAASSLTGVPRLFSRSQKKLVTLEARHHTRGSVLFAWQPQGSVLATCGQNRVLNIFNRQGEAQVEIPLTSGNGCAAHPASDEL